eukprot:2570716-Alexandrium_andersonii.AAC.1
MSRRRRATPAASGASGAPLAAPGGKRARQRTSARQASPKHASHQANPRRSSSRGVRRAARARGDRQRAQLRGRAARSPADRVRGEGRSPLASNRNTWKAA